MGTPQFPVVLAWEGRGGGLDAAVAKLYGLARAAAQRQGASWARGSRSWGGGCPTQVVDPRGDTVTKPGPAVRHAQVEAVLRDDYYGENSAVHGEPGVRPGTRGRLGDPGRCPWC